MPNPNGPTSLPQAATERMSPNAQQKLPPNIAPPVNIIYDDPATLQIYQGTTGVTDVFVFDLSKEGYGDNAIDGIDNFEADRDVVAFINASSDFSYEDSANVAMIRELQSYPGNDLSIPNSLTATWNDSFTVGETVYVFDTLETNTSFSNTNEVHLANGTIILV